MKLYNGECLEVMDLLIEQGVMVDAIICDPPYNIGKDFGNDSDKQKMSDYKAIDVILKIWLANCTHQNPKQMSPINGLNVHGCIFKKHRPQF